MSGTDYYRADTANIPHNGEGKPLKGGPWVRAGETDIANAGCWCSNNSRIGVVCFDGEGEDEKGAVFVGRDTALNRKLLEEANFKPRSFFIPLSNNEDCDTSLRNEVTAHQRQFMDEFRNLPTDGYKILPWSYSYKATGVEFKRKSDGEIETVQRVEDTHLLGRYNVSRTGILAFTDLNGDTFITRDDKDIRDRLENQGLQKSVSLYVPFGQGELPVREIRTNQDIESFIKTIQGEQRYDRGLRLASSSLSV